MVCAGCALSLLAAAAAAEAVRAMQPPAFEVEGAEEAEPLTHRS
jgi:hypothetical protein